MINDFSAFKEKNPQVNISQEDGNIILSNLWEDESFNCKYPKDTDLSELGDIFLPPYLSAIQHIEKQFIEFIWGPVEKNHRLLERKFEFIYSQKTFVAEFTDPSNVLRILATGFTPIGAPTITDYRNLRLFRDYYRNPTYLQDFFKDKTGAVFKVTGNFDDVDLISFAKTLNFYIHYFDRFSPFVLIFDNYKKEKYPTPCFSKYQSFPKIVSGHKMDPILIDLFEVARKTANIRLKFLFYYQVLEYCSYYHLNETLKKKLTNIIKRPDLMSNTLEYGRLITEEFKDFFKTNDDSQKMGKLLEDFINNSDIRNEVSANIEFFKKPYSFDGGFTLEALINNEQELELGNKDLVKKIKTHIEKIRNVLVHIRESRENKVILPTEKNSDNLRPYLYLVQRISEHVAINYE